MQHLRHYALAPTRSSSALLGNKGHVYVNDYGLNINRLQIFGSSGNFLMSYNNGFNSPSGVAVDGNGNIFVADTGNSRIQQW